MPGFNYIINDDCGGQAQEYFGPDPNMEYARQNRYQIEFFEPFGDIRTGILLYATKCSRPTIEFDKVVIHNGYNEIYRPGKHRYSPLEFSFSEIVPNESNVTASKIYEWWTQTVLIRNQSKFNNQNAYLKSANVKLLDGAGKSIWEYNLYDCWPIKVTPTELNSREYGPTEIQVTLSFDSAKER